ncbi:MAG: Hsp20/alpha crystallin family protein [Catalinimonas sp.]
MSLVRFRPYSPMSNLTQVFDNFFSDDLMHSFGREQVATLPAVNVREEEDAFVLEVAAPGLKKENFKLNLNHDLLTIGSHFEEEQTEAHGKFTRREFNYGAFERSFRLPKSVDGDQINARYEDGVLHIALPKREEAKVKPARQIEIG